MRVCLLKKHLDEANMMHIGHILIAEFVFNSI